MPYFLVKAYFVVEAGSGEEAESVAAEVLGTCDVVEDKICWVEGPYECEKEAIKALQEAED